MSRHDNSNEVEPEAGPGWITRAEARALLGVSEIEMRELSRGFHLSRRTIPLYSKAEIQALRAIARQLN